MKEGNTVDQVAGERVRRVAGVVDVRASTQNALDIMNAEGIDALPVVDDAERLLGVVLRKGIERGCKYVGHDSATCAVRNHLKRTVLFCFESEPVTDELLTASRTQPVVVVDLDRRPTGLLAGDDA